MLNKWLRLLCLLAGGLMAPTAYGGSPGIVPDPDRYPLPQGQQERVCAQDSGLFEYHLGLAEAILGGSFISGNDVGLPRDDPTGTDSTPQLGVASK